MEKPARCGVSGRRSPGFRSRGFRRGVGVFDKRGLSLRRAEPRSGPYLHYAGCATPAFLNVIVPPSASMSTRSPSENSPASTRIARGSSTRR